MKTKLYNVISPDNTKSFPNQPLNKDVVQVLEDNGYCCIPVTTPDDRRSAMIVYGD